MKKLWVLSLLLLLSISNYAQSTLSQGLVGYYPFNGNASYETIEKEYTRNDGMIEDYSGEQDSADIYGANNASLKISESGRSYSRIELEDSVGWSLQLSNQPGLSTIFFIDTLVGWVAGDFGRIFKTTNGGKVWVQLNDITFKPNSIYFTDTSNGYAVGGSGLIAKTTNSGQSWFQINSPTNVELFQVYFLNNEIGLICGADGKILRTTNSGLLWDVRTFFTHYWRGISFIDENNGWIVGGSNVLRTEDAGNTWTHIGSTNYTFNSVHFFNSKDGIAAGPFYVLKTSNGGSYWHILKDLNGPLYSISFSDSLNGIVSGYNQISITTNSGITWETAAIDANWWFSSQMLDINNAWVAGGLWQSGDGRVMKYSNRKPWVRDVSPKNDIDIFGGDTLNITWNTGYIKNIRIEKTNQNGLLQESIGDNISALDNFFNWVVPNKISNSSKVKITDISSGTYSLSKGSFSIKLILPSAPLLSFPSNNSYGIVTPCKFIWHKERRAFNYVLNLSTHPDFIENSISIENINDTTYLIPHLIEYSTYYWRVKAVNEMGESAWSEVWSFKTLGRSYAVQLHSPADKSQNLSISQIELKWFKPMERIETVYKYQFQFASDSLFTTLIVNDSTLHDTVTQVRDLNYLSSYYWRVRAYNEAGWGDWSSVWSFTTIIQKPLTPLLASPITGSKGLVQPVLLKWHPALRAEVYLLEVAKTPDFMNSSYVNLSIADTFMVLPELEVYTQYYWRVQAKNIGGFSIWSDIWSFKTLGSSYAVTLLQPADNAVNLPVTNLQFGWKRPAERIETVVKYHYQLASDAEFSTLVINDTTLTDTLFTAGGLMNSSIYFWRVRALNETGWGDWSAVRSFTTIIAAPEVPLLASPENNQKGMLNPVTVVWNRAVRAERYILQVSTAQDFSALVYEQNSVTDTFRTLPQLAVYTQYYWRVKAVNTGGESSWSEVRTFKLLGSPYAVTLVQPVNLASQQPAGELTFIWNKPAERIEQISRYHFRLSGDSLFASLAGNDSTLADTLTQRYNLMNGTEYWWKVRAGNETGWGDWSEPFRFTTIIAVPPAVALAQPLYNLKGVTNPVTVQWHPSERAASYILQVTQSTDFSTLILSDSSLTDTSRLITNLSNYTIYYWRVKGKNTGGEGNWSSIWNFRTLGQPYMVQLVLPQDDAVNLPVTGLQFAWLKPAERIEAVSGYHIELAVDETMTTVIYTDTTLTDTMVTVAGPLEHLTRYWWRVRAKNQTGWGDWSNTRKFTTIIEQPAVTLLLIPANNAVEVNQPVKLSWMKSLRAERYILAVSDTLQFTTLILSDSLLTDTMRVLPQLNTFTVYYWRVTAKNTGGASGASEIWNFRTLGAPTAVTLLLPENGAVQVPASVQFVWTKASHQKSAIQYWFELYADTTAQPLHADSALADTATSLQLENDRTYFWKVRAGNEAGWSAFSSWSSFTTIVPLAAAPQPIAPQYLASGLDLVQQLVWAHAEYADIYHLQMATDPQFQYLVINDSTLTDTVRLTDSLDYKTAYYWRLRSGNEAGYGLFSAVWRFTTMIRSIVPPGDLVITPVADLKVRLQWSDYSDNEEGFLILRKEGDSLSANEYILVDQVPADSVSFTDTTVTIAAGYSYLIVAFNEDTVSDGGAYAYFQITGIEEWMTEIPDEYSLSQNYPNPFNPSTLIVFGLPEDAFVDIRIYDISGSLVRIFTGEELKAGSYRMRWDGRNEYGSAAPSGIYLCRMTTKNFTAVEKLMLVK